MNQVEQKRRQAELIADMIGIINLLVLGALLKNNGIAYLAVAVEAASFFLLLISEGTADTLGKILRGRNTREQYKNAEKMRKNAMLLQLVSGLLGSAVLCAAAKFLTEQVFKLPYSTFLLLILVPAVFLRTISEVFLGYFQGDGSELPTAASAILRQVVLFGFSVLFCKLFMGYGEKVSALLGKEEFTAMYGGMGVALAIGLTEVLVLLFLFLIRKGKRDVKRRQSDEGKKATESFSDFGKLLYGGRGVPLLLGLFKKLPIWLGILFFQKSMENRIAAADAYGLFYGKYLAVCMFLVCFAGIFLLSVCGKTAAFLRKEEHRYARNNFQSGGRFAWEGGLFTAVFFTIMAPKIAELLCGAPNKTAAMMFLAGSSMILFALMAFYFENSLLIAGNKLLAILSLAVMNVVFAVSATVFLNKGIEGVLALVYAGLTAGGVYSILLGYFTYQKMRCNVKPVQTFAVPVGAAGLSGLCCMRADKLFSPHLGVIVLLLICLVVSLCVYLGVLRLAGRFFSDSFNV